MTDRTHLTAYWIAYSFMSPTASYGKDPHLASAYICFGSE